jgi:hypothetical protein
MAKPNKIQLFNGSGTKHSAWWLTSAAYVMGLLHTLRHDSHEHATFKNCSRCDKVQVQLLQLRPNHFISMLWVLFTKNSFRIE